MYIITKQAADLAKDNYRTLGRLMTYFNKHQTTIVRWLNEQDNQLSVPAAVQIIKEETGLREDQILEEETENIRG